MAMEQLVAAFPAQPSVASHRGLEHPIREVNLAYGASPAAAVAWSISVTTKPVPVVSDVHHSAPLMLVRRSTRTITAESGLQTSSAGVQDGAPHESSWSVLLR